jgi:hypothetical protein
LALREDIHDGTKRGTNPWSALGWLLSRLGIALAIIGAWEAACLLAETGGLRRPGVDADADRFALVIWLNSLFGGLLLWALPSFGARARAWTPGPLVLWSWRAGVVAAVACIAGSELLVGTPAPGSPGFHSALLVSGSWTLLGVVLLLVSCLVRSGWPWRRRSSPGSGASRSEAASR